MKIAINSRIFQEKYSGIQNYVFSLYSRIIKMDRENDYVFLQTRDNNIIGETQVSGYVPGNIGKMFFDWFLIVLSLKKIHGQILHGPSFALPFIKIAGYKYIVSIHDLAFLVYPEHYSWFFRKYMYLTVLNSIKKADAIICISESTSKDLSHYFPKVIKEKLHVIPLGVAGDFFVAPIQERIITEKYFFSLTTHPRRKNILRILDVMAENREELRDYTYVIAGIFGPDSLAVLQSKIEVLDLTSKVRIYGYASHEEVKNLYAHAEFFVYPSYYEGFGLPILEAIACGCPVISSDNSSLPEVNKDIRCMFNAHDNAHIYQTMRYILNMSVGERIKYIEDNRALARSFSWDITAAKTIQLFNSLR